MRIAYPVGRKAIRIIVYPKSVINRLSPNDRFGFNIALSRWGNRRF